MGEIKSFFQKAENRIQTQIFLLSILIITFCSKNSFLYAFNDGYDINVYKTIGRGVWRGLLPYRDLYDHKGPYMYLPATLEAKIPYSIYLIEIICCFFTLYYAYKILDKYNEYSIFKIIAFGCVAYFSVAFSHGGSVTEEFFLPIQLHTIYIGIKNDGVISKKDAFIIGILSGFFFWSKYSLMGFFIGWCLYPFYKTQKETKETLKCMGYIILGVLCTTIPVLLAFHNALPDLFTVYFIDNITQYPVRTGDGPILNTVIGLVATSFCSLVIAIFAVIGLIRKHSVYYISTFICMAFLTFSSGNHFRYYILPFVVFSLLGIGWIKSKIILLIISVICVATAPNLQKLSVKLEDTPQYKFAQIINEKEDPSFLNYGFIDGGFYLVSGVEPKTRHFCKLNLEDGMDEMTQMVADGDFDFVITNQEVSLSKYHLVSQATAHYEIWDFTYCLYERN